MQEISYLDSTDTPNVGAVSNRLERHGQIGLGSRPPVGVSHLFHFVR